MSDQTTSSDITNTDVIEPITQCTECQSTNLVLSGSEIVCQDCGMVVGNNIVSLEPEWRAFTQEEKNSRERSGAPLSSAVHDKGLSTVIGKPSAGASVEERETVKRLKKWQVRTRVHSSVDRNLIQALSELSRLSERLHVPSPVKEQAALIYRQSLEKDLVRGRSIAAIVAASLYCACRLNRLPRTLKQVADYSSVSQKDIARCFRLIVRELTIRMPVPNASSKVTTIASKIAVSEVTQQVARTILDEAGRLKMTAGKDPMGLAAAALYIACVITGEHKTQKSIAEAANVTEVTIRNRYKGLCNMLGEGGLEELEQRISSGSREEVREDSEDDSSTG